MLGGFDASLNGSRVAGISYNKMRALLAYLAVEREQDHKREVLAELLWGDNDPETARGNLRRTLSDLRRVLDLPTGTALFSADKHTIRFSPNCYIDALEFTSATSCIAAPSTAYCDPCLAQMEHVAGLYRGEFMAGFSLPDCPDFEDWLQIQREALHLRALALLEKLSNCHEQFGVYGSALPFALRYTELEPWDEAGHRRTMRLYALNGQVSAAIRQYETCCHLLKKELGALPGEETRQLAERIRKDQNLSLPPHRGKAGMAAMTRRCEASGAGMAASHPLQQSARFAITSDLASVAGSPSRMASSSISNVSQDVVVEQLEGKVSTLSLAFPLQGGGDTQHPHLQACSELVEVGEGWGEDGLNVPPPQPTAERRQVTVLYCELTLAAIDDPDEAMALLRPAQNRCMEIIRQFSGHIVQAHGGGLLAYFGYPQAREDAARFAVQAALAVTREAAHGIEIRAGVHTGLIITGGEFSMPDLVGKTSSVAIQLRHCVAYNEVAISQETRGMVAGYFDCISLGVQLFSGVALPVEIFKVARESGAHSRLDAAAQLTPLAGRKAEIAGLMALWEEAAHGARHVVLVQGEAGIGKSRLLLTLKERLRDKPHAIRELRCFPEFSQSPFYPLIAMLDAILGFAHGDTPEIKFGKLAQYLETHYPAAAQHAVPLLAQLLCLSLGEHYHAPRLPPQQQKEQTIAILLGLLQALAVQQPALLIVEDLHWIDPSTLELLAQFVEQKESGPILALLTARPEFDPPWDETLETLLALAPLVDDEVAQMIASLSGDIPAATIRRIVERADGVPLFAEEMAKIATLDNQASIPVNIPATLHDLLAARMDNMGEAKYTAQLAAALGREFDVDLLRKVSLCNPAALAHSLNVLQDAGLFLKNSTPIPPPAPSLKGGEHTHPPLQGEGWGGDGLKLVFKHALIQEAAYQSQTKATRQAAHQRIAHILQSDFPDVVTNQPELLAQHLFSAGEARQSIEYWIKAGQRAARSSANLEAIGHFNSALQLLQTLPADQDRDKAEFKMLIGLCALLYAAIGYGSEEATRANARLSALSGRVGDSPELFHAQWALAMNTMATVGPRGMPEAAMQLLGIAHDDPLKKQLAHFAVANAAYWFGDFGTTRAHLEQASALYHPEHRQMQLEQTGGDLFHSGAAVLSCALYFLGHPKQAQHICGRTLQQAYELAHPHNLGMVLSSASFLHRWLNKPAETLSLSAEAIAIARQYGFSVWLAMGEVTHGWALVMLGREEGIAELKSGIAGMRVAIRGIPVDFLIPLIEAYTHLKRYDEALDLLAEAQADAANTGDEHSTAELHCLKGTCLLARSPPNTAQAEACFDQSLAISRKQGAKSLELRAATSMARLWQQQGKHDEARNMLKKIYNWFTEGFDTHDLREAKELLDALQ